MSRLVGNQLTVVRDSRMLLRKVDLTLHRGELHVLLGANGAGKSSLIKALAGEWPAQGGTISLGGVPLHTLDALEQARRRAVLPQRDSLAFAFTVRELIGLGCLAAQDQREAQRTVVVAEVLDAVDLTALADRPYTQLSEGERRRAQLARVLAQVWHTPDAILLLDEPAASLDPAHQHAVLALLVRLAAKGFAILASLHELDLAAGYADRISLLRDGALLASGPTREVLSSETLRSTYGDGMDFAAVEHAGRRHWLGMGARRT